MQAKEKKKATRTSPRGAFLGCGLLAFHALLERLVLFALPPVLF
jgi:hypothetical protein